MHANPLAENILGTMGTIFWTIQLIPQIWKTWRDKSVEGLSPWLVFIWGISAAPYGTYAIVQDLNIPLIIQPQLFSLLNLVSWGQCQYYGSKRSRGVALSMTFCVMTLVGAFQLAMIFIIRPHYPQSESASRAVQSLGILGSALISLALLPQYYTIYKHKEVIGISIAFMLIDLLGGVFFDLSLAFKDYFDVIAAVTYTLVVIMDGIVILAALILNPRARRLRRLQAESTVIHDSGRSNEPSIPPSLTPGETEEKKQVTGHNLHTLCHHDVLKIDSLLQQRGRHPN